MALGRENPGNHDEEFCMTVLGLKLSRRANAVSALHGEVSRAMWTGLYPGKPEEAVPIGHITNGVHVPSWLAPQMFRLYDRHLGDGLAEHSGEPRIWEGIENVDDGELWETHLSLKSRLLEFVRRRAVEQAERRERTGRNAAAAGPRAQSRRADDRLRPPLRHLQARQPDSGRHREAGRRWSTIRSGRCSSFSPARRIPRDEPGKRVLQQIAAADARPAVRRQVRLRRRLRHQRRPPFRAGRRRLAEQSAAAAGSVGHQRPEGGPERRAESFGARRLVGGSLRRPERLRHRHRPNALQHGCSRQRAMAKTSTACCAKK